MKMTNIIKHFILIAIFTLITSAVYAEEFTINHQVQIWLKEGLPKNKISSVIKATHALSSIEQVKNFEILYPLIKTKATTSSFTNLIKQIKNSVCGDIHVPYTFAINMRFKNQEDLQKYIQSKTHKSYVNKDLSPNLEKITIYDSKITPF